MDLSFRWCDDDDDDNNNNNNNIRIIMINDDDGDDGDDGDGCSSTGTQHQFKALRHECHFLNSYE